MRARVEIDAPGRVHESLEPSLETAPGGRAEAEIRHEDGRLILEVEAEDASAMRAALNTWLRLARVSLEVSDLPSYKDAPDHL